MWPSDWKKAAEKAWNNAPSTGQVLNNAKKTVEDTGKNLQKGANDLAKKAQDGLNQAGKGINDAWNNAPYTGDLLKGAAAKVDEFGGATYNAMNDMKDYANIPQALWENAFGYPCFLNGVSEKNDGSHYFEVMAELRIMNTFGDSVTDTFTTGFEKIGCDLAEDDADGENNNCEFIDPYKGPTGFNRVYKMKLILPNTSYNTIREKFKKKINETMKKIHVANGSLISVKVRTIPKFTSYYENIPKNLKQLMKKIQGEKVSAKEATNVLSAELKKKLDAKIKKEIDKKIRKAVAKRIARILMKNGVKATTKSVFKKVPGVGAVVGFGYGVARLAEGDVAGAGLEIASGAASTIPGPGTAISLALDAAGLAYDLKDEIMGWYEVNKVLD